MRPGPAFTTSRLARGSIALAVAALVALPGCGGSSGSGKTIPRNQADRMIALIQLADQRTQAGKCSSAAAKVTEAQSVLDSLPSSVDTSVRQGIADGLSRLRGLIAAQCQKPQTTTTDTTTVDTNTVPTDTNTIPTDTNTVPTNTQTTPTDTNTVPTTTIPTTPTTTGNGGTPTSTGAQGTGE